MSAAEKQKMEEEARRKAEEDSKAAEANALKTLERERLAREREA